MNPELQSLLEKAAQLDLKLRIHVLYEDGLSISYFNYSNRGKIVSKFPFSELENKLREVIDQSISERDAGIIKTEMPNISDVEIIWHPVSNPLENNTIWLAKVPITDRYELSINTSNQEFLKNPLDYEEYNVAIYDLSIGEGGKAIEIPKAWLGHRSYSDSFFY